MGLSPKQLFFYNSGGKRTKSGRFRGGKTKCSVRDTMVIRLATYSRHGKSTFVRRLTSVLVGAATMTHTHS
ncbi:putative phosphoribulokinase [Helianthus annuus]|nr:putative phosphoribulokinase [Helianthus annuus]